MARRAEALEQPRHEELFQIKKSATGWLPSRPNFCKLAGPGAESAPVPGLNKPSGRSQRGDSAWCKTLDHLLSLLMEHSV